MDTSLYSVTTYVSEALSESLRRYGDRFSVDQKTLIKNLITKLSRPTFDDLCSIVDEAIDIFISLKIESS